jgi:pyruvate dehydrogenase E1 component alpha subunit
LTASSPRLDDRPAEERIALYGRMVLIRKAEERLARDFKAGLLPGPVHLYIGEEAVAVGVCAHLTDRDWITSTHRGHGHFLAKGGDLDAMLAEVHGRATGICGGMGGSMHVADFSRGILGANGIVAGGIAMATGAGLAQQLEGAGGVAVAFFGDGATGEGVLAESLNIAALWKLPVVFVCENNFYSEFSPVGNVIAGEIVDRAKPYGIPAVAVDGNDLAAVWAAAGEAIGRARAGGGPGFIEARTYRFHGHVEGETAFLRETYRAEEEVSEKRGSDPLAAFRSRLTASGAAGDNRLADLEAELAASVEDAAARAAEAPLPDPARLGELAL